jgi:hypothetical protein
VQLRGQTAVHAEYLLVDDSCNGHAIEALGEEFPQFDVVSPLALVVEAIDPVDGGTLVVPTQQEEVQGVLDLVGQQQADGFQTLLASVDVVPQEDIVGIGREASIFEESQQVIVLAMDIPADFDGGLQLQQAGLVDEDLSALDDQPFDFILCQVHWLSWLAASDFKKLGDDGININFKVLLLIAAILIFLQFSHQSQRHGEMEMERRWRRGK